MNEKLTIASAALLLFLVMDPLGNVPFFLAALRHVEPNRIRKVIVRELLIALAVLVFFLFTGRFILELLQISDPALTLAGGVILFLIALRMVFPTPETSMQEGVDGEPFIVPLAIPYVAGPSALATELLLMSREPDRWRDWLVALVLAWFVAAVIIYFASSLRHILGQKGLIAVERLMGMVLITVAIQMLLSGIREALNQRPAVQQRRMPDRLQRTADALRASEVRLRTILDTAVDAFISINSAGIVESFNPAAERMFGYPADEVIGHNVSMLMPPPFAEEHDDYLRRYLATGERKIIGIGREAVGRRKDGSIFPLDLAVGEATIDGQSVFTGVIRDLTERKKLESNLLRAQRMELVGSLAGGIAHDLNNVLAVILTAAGNLQLDLAEAERRQVLDELMTAARRGITVVRQIVSFARGVTPGSGLLDARALLHDFERLLRHLLPRSVAIQMGIPQDLPPLAGDEAQLYQVLLNLCVNARDAMPHGGNLKLNIQTAELPATESANGAAQRYVVITVEDTGIGIPAEKLETIFEPFYTTKPLGQGTGLGLATVRDLVRGLGGFVRVASTVGRGTQFTIYWPEARPERGRALAAPVGHGELILIADSDRSSAELARAALETYGYRTAMAYDASGALAHLVARSAEVSLVVIDAATSLTAHDIRTAAPRACVVGLGSVSDCNVCIEKPFPATDLLRAVSRALTSSDRSS